MQHGITFGVIVLMCVRLGVAIQHYHTVIIHMYMYVELHVYNKAHHSTENVIEFIMLHD